MEPYHNRDKNRTITLKPEIMKRKYKIVVRNKATQEEITTFEKASQGEALTELLIYGGVQKDDEADHHGIEWEMSVYPMPLTKGTLIQLYGVFTNNWSPAIKGIGTKA